MIVIINDEGLRLCCDNRWRSFANFGSYKECVKTYKTVGSAKKTAKKVQGKIAQIPSDSKISRSVDSCGTVFEERERSLQKKDIQDFIVWDARVWWAEKTQEMN